MDSRNFVGCFMVLITVAIGLIRSVEGYKFNVGGRDGWVVSPKESFNHWAERNRFQINDSLVFKYKNGSDSVLVVRKEDYFACNAKNPIQTLTDGNSELKFDRSGPFFFISGNEDSCNKGQKLIVVVLAVSHTRHYTPLASPAPSPTTEIDSPPSPPVASPSLSPVSSPLSESPQAGGDFPTGVSPVPVPTASQKNYGCLGSEVSGWLVVGLSLGVSVFLGSFSVV